MKQEHSCGFVLFRQLGDKRYYLILHYKAGHWDFPKGHVEEGETEEETARRELHEETGIREAHVIPGFRHEYIYQFGRSERAVREKKVTFYLARTNQSHVRVSREHTGSRWVPFSRAMVMLTFPNARLMMEAAENHLLELEKARGPAQD